VLIEAVARLRRSVRPEDLVARWGGEEFLIVCRDTGGRALARLAQRARAGIAARPFTTSAGEIAVTASAGAVAGPGPARNADALVDAADAALLAAKGAGKDRVVTAGAGEAPDTAAA
jgi:diguanylate cyclase (GGDEF)-like protein